jgi:hypothetical protein
VARAAEGETDCRVLVVAVVVVVVIDVGVVGVVDMILAVDTILAVVVAREKAVVVRIGTGLTTGEIPPLEFQPKNGNPAVE